MISRTTASFWCGLPLLVPKYRFNKKGKNMENSISDGQHRHGEPTPTVNCLFCKSPATIPVTCSCGFIRCRVCHAHRDISAMQRFIDQEFGCRNPKCPKCDRELLAATKRVKELLGRLANLNRDDTR